MTLWCTPILVPTMLPGGSAADIRVKPSDSRVAEIHLRGHQIVRFAFMEKVSLFHCVSLGTFEGAEAS